MKNKKKLWIIVIVALVAAALCGGYLLLDRRGMKTQGSLAAVYNPSAIADANLNTPYALPETEPSGMGFETRLMADGQEVTGGYQREEAISFGADNHYTDLEGIITFRGNNFRDAAGFGNPVVSAAKLDKLWEIETGSMDKGDTTKGKGSDEWSGSGWTGQPIIVRWDGQTRQTMNLYDDKKAKDGLVEVIYATMDGNVYFLDLEDGTRTRDELSIGLPFKGAGAIDPRGIPLFFVGAGDSMTEEKGDAGAARVFIYSLTDFTKLYEFGAQDAFSPREFHAYDSSPLVDAETDTLLYPGENAVLYTMKLNTEYDAQTGALSIAPSNEVKWTYGTDRTSEEEFWWGMEDSAVIWENYMYMADNAGNMMCVDLNTMELVWAQDVKDDTNASPVFEEDAAGNKFIYIAPSLHWQKYPGKDIGQVSIYKINAITGEIVWEKPYETHTVANISGGVQATAVCGKGGIDDLVILPMARVPYKNTGMLVALDKETGEERWTFDMAWAWSSPVAVYADDGRAYIVQCDSDGMMYLLDGQTGELLDKIDLGGKVEASPAVFDNTIVVGTRSKKIVGIGIS